MVNKDKEGMVTSYGFTMPKEEAEQFQCDVEITAKAAKEIMEEYCVRVERKIEDPREGEAIIGYIADGTVAFKVLLDPFEVPIMKMAMSRGRLKAYIFAKNGITEDDMLQINK